MPISPKYRPFRRNIAPFAPFRAKIAHFAETLPLSPHFAQKLPISYYSSTQIYGWQLTTHLDTRPSFIITWLENLSGLKFTPSRYSTPTNSYQYQQPEGPLEAIDRLTCGPGNVS